MNTLLEAVCLNNKANTAILFVFLAPLCNGVSFPFSKLLLAELSPALLASSLYLGAVIGMSAFMLARRIKQIEPKEADDIKGITVY